MRTTLKRFQTKGPKDQETRGPSPDISPLLRALSPLVPWSLGPFTSRLCLLLILAVATAACTNVKPWQRETLSDPTMRADRDPIGTAFADHINFSREAATGGRSVGGGGCGCN